MKSREIRKELETSGMVLIRKGSKHDIYQHPKARDIVITISRGSGSTAPRTLKSMMSKLRKVRETP